MNKNDWVLLTKVPDLIIRGALISRLGEKQIEVYAPDQDVIVNLSSTSPNLSLEGYSAMFDGYKVYVDRRSKIEAEKVWKEFELEVNQPSETEPDHAQKFYTMAVMSFLLPLIFHILAFYQLRLGIKKGQKFSKPKVLFSIFVMLPGLYLAVFYLSSLLDHFQQ